MGDRGNVKVIPEWEDSPPFYLYTHWCGSELEEIVRDALTSEAGQARLDDGAYLARIVFEHMLSHAVDKETGFGIATSPPDNEHPFVVLDLKRHEFRRETEFGEVLGEPIPLSDFKS